MSKLQRRKHQAAAKGCYAFRRGTWPTYESALTKYDVYVESEGPLGPRDLKLSKRQAVALAYSVSVAKRQAVVICTS